MDKINKENVLFSKQLCCYPYAPEAAKLYHKFLIEHPEYDNDDIKCKIKEIEEEEDHYGNGGGIRRTLVIYKDVEETDAEYELRIHNIEDDIIKTYSNKLKEILKELNYKLNYMPSKERVVYEITKYIDMYIKNNY